MCGGAEDIHEQLERAIREVTTAVVQHLVAGNFSVLQRLSGGKRLSGEEMRCAIQEYGRTLVMPPPDALSNLDVVEVHGVHPASWSVVCALWTAEEGLSDLSLELTVTDRGETQLSVEIDDIHVL